MPSQREVLWLSKSVMSVYTAMTVRELAFAMTSAVDEIFNPMFSACEEIGMGASSYSLHRVRTAVTPPKDHAAYIHDHPFTPQLGAKRRSSVLHMRQLLSMDAWARTDHFNGIARPMGFNDGILLIAQASPTMVTTTLARDIAFSSRERDLLSLLQPHFAAAWHRVRAFDFATTTDALHVTLARGLTPISLNVSVRQLLKAYFANWTDDGRLPTSVAAWVAHSMAELRAEPAIRPLRALATDSARGRLLIRLFPDKHAQLVQLVMVEVPSSPNFLRLQRFGLTIRESEVLHWIAQAKRDLEIAAILGIAAKTVCKHVENALRKLNAPNRTAAVSTACRLLEDQGARVQRTDAARVG